MDQAVSAIILSGGKGVRMNHQNKGLMNYQRRPLVQHVIDRVTQQVDDIVISANQDIEAYERFGYPVVADRTESLGPLTGILSASAVTQHPIILIVPCDMPKLPLNLVEQLLVAMTTNAISISSGGRSQPLVSLINRKAISTISTYLQNGDRSVHGWLKTINGATLSWEDSGEAFRNINDMSDLSI